MQMKTSHNTKDPSELCTICEININVPSAELGPTVCTDRHTHTQKKGRIVLRCPGNSEEAVR